MTKEPLRVKVKTHKLAEMQLQGFEPVYVLESAKIIDHNDSSDRKWLGAHCFWAFRNQRRVTTTPVN